MSYSTKVLNTISSKDFLRMSTLSYMMDKKCAVYGREIITHIKDRGAIWSPSHGSLYPLLNEMVKDNLLYVDDMVGKKKYYQLTDEGRDYYKKAATDFVDMLITTSKFYENFAKDFEKDLHIEENGEVKGV